MTVLIFTFHFPTEVPFCFNIKRFVYIQQNAAGAPVEGTIVDVIFTALFFW